MMDITRVSNGFRITESEPIVKLPRLKVVIRCPGCSRSFIHKDHCAEHLLKTCIRCRSDGDVLTRRNLISWILNYYKTFSYGDDNPPDAVKINSILNDEEIRPSSKARLFVNLPELEETMRCPVCFKFFYNSDACSAHLFRDCLYTKNGTIARIQIWLSEYFSIKTERSLSVLKELFAKYSPSTVECKYCKLKFPHEEALMIHFRIEHCESENFERFVCVICNSSLLNEEKLVKHMLSKHVKCEFKYVRCPICRENIFSSFEKHISNCKRIEKPSFDSIFTKCRVCSSDVILSEIDSHLKWHLKCGDEPSRRQKRFEISSNEWRNYPDEKIQDLRNPCNCKLNGNVH